MRSIVLQTRSISPQRWWAPTAGRRSCLFRWPTRRASYRRITPPSITWADRSPFSIGGFHFFLVGRYSSDLKGNSLYWGADRTSRFERTGELILRGLDGTH